MIIKLLNKIMGKRLIIKGADFSQNGIIAPKDITSLFSVWTSGTLDVYGNNKTSSVYARSNAVDISAFVGRTMQFTNSAYQSASGDRPLFYSCFFDADGNLISAIRVYKSNEIQVGYTVVDEVTIPADAKTFVATYFDTTKSHSFVFEDFRIIGRETCEVFSLAL